MSPGVKVRSYVQCNGNGYRTELPVAQGRVNLSDGGNISGVTTSTLTINNVATADEGSYDVVITGLCSNVTSAAALLAVDDNVVITAQPVAVHSVKEQRLRSV